MDQLNSPLPLTTVSPSIAHKLSKVNYLHEIDWFGRLSGMHYLIAQAIHFVNEVVDSLSQICVRFRDEMSRSVR
jgi:hypothetical protein